MKKIMSLCLVLTMVISLASGCGSKEETKTASDTAVTTDTEVKGGTDSTDEVAQTEEILEPSKVELNIMMSISRYTEQMEQYAEQFKAKMLAEENVDVTINLEMPSADSYRQILQTRLSSGEAPDLFTLHAIQDIPTYDDGEYLMDLSNEAFVGTLYDDMKGTVTRDGKVLAVPMESLAWGYLYNKDIFEDAGVTPPNTIEEMKVVIEKLTAKGYTPFELSFQESWVPQLMTALSIGGTVSSVNKDWVERMNNDEGSYDEIVGIFDIIDLIMENGTDRPFETGFDQGCVDFANGEAAMWVNGTWATESILNSNPDVKIGVGALPVNDDPESAMVNLSTSTSLAVYSGTDEPAMALAFANYLLDAEDSSDLYQSMLFSPVSSVHNYDQFSWNEEAYEYVSKGRAYLDLVLPNAVTNEQAALLQDYYLKGITVEEFISAMDETYEEANRVKNSN